MNDFQEEAIKIIDEKCEGPFVEVCCGSGWLVSNLKGDKLGVDPSAPNGPIFKRMTFLNFILADHQSFEQARTIIMCYPPGPSPNYVVGEQVVSALSNNQVLVVIGPKPYEEMIVIGTTGMWQTIFKKTVLVMDPIKIQGSDMAYILKVGNGLADGTEQKIMNGHSLWELNGVKYDI